MMEYGCVLAQHLFRYLPGRPRSLPGARTSLREEEDTCGSLALLDDSVVFEGVVSRCRRCHTNEQRDTLNHIANTSHTGHSSLSTSF